MSKITNSILIQFIIILFFAQLLCLFPLCITVKYGRYSEHQPVLQLVGITQSVLVSVMFTAT